LARQGLEITQEGPVYRVRNTDARPQTPTAEVLLPHGFPLESKALLQLSRFAAVEHPDGGQMCHACATPDFHPGSLVPVGAIVASADLVVPQAIGTDINCGMRLHVSDVSVDEFLAHKAAFVERIKGDLLLGSRDLPSSVLSMRAMFEQGVDGWLEQAGRDRMGLLERSDFVQLEAELDRIYHRGSTQGDARWVPPGLLPKDRGVVRDPCLGTVGGGNHFVEVQRVVEVHDRQRAWEWGVRVDQLAIMVHSGSRNVGTAVGTRWAELARERWPRGTKWPDIFSLAGDDAQEYLRAMNTAANYATVNRLLLVEIVRDHLRALFGDRAIPLVFDVPHNIVLEEDALFVHRKGATPAHAGQPVLIPGSMGHPSHLMVGRGNPQFLSSCSHGAGRAITRFDMTRKGRPRRDLGLDGVECVTLRDERKLEEAPAAYKDIGPVVDVQVEQGLVGSVAVLEPLLTFKA
jgi:tRNA-splicing ligase RtcB